VLKADQLAAAEHPDSDRLVSAAALSRSLALHVHLPASATPLADCVDEWLDVHLKAWDVALVLVEDEDPSVRCFSCL
jgi:hypothetical protein